jgi:HEAT repeats
MRPLLVLAALVLAPARLGTQTAPPPNVSNGPVLERPVTGGFQPAFTRIAAGVSDVAWIGYAVPLVAGDHRMCCGKDDGADCCAGCRLEPGPKGTTSSVALPPPAGPVRLEPSHTLVVLVRVERGQVERIRTFSDTCRLDAGGRTVYWLTGVRPAESVAWLGTQATVSTTRRSSDGATSALALHAEPAALDWLLGTARTGSSTHLRGQALFWLSQRAGERAVGAIAEAVERDPDTDVKRRAVFALSQLPADEGVPRLIQVARSHSNKAVQKQAFFWLGQSKDPRALAFFSEILKTR